VKTRPDVPFGVSLMTNHVYGSKSSKTHFGGPFNAKPIIQRALYKSHVNGATQLKLYIYIVIGKYLGVCQTFSARGTGGGQGPIM